MKKLLAVSLALAAAAVLPAKDKKDDPDAIGTRNVAGSVNFYSIEKELALGKQLAIEVEKQVKIVDDPIVSEYINRLGQSLVRHSDVTFPVSFKVIDSAEINAFTLPGGHIFINTGLIGLSANESQLAAAMAHELGHAAGRHATRQATRREIAGLGAIPLIVLGGLPGLAASGAAGTVVPLAFLKSSREFENEADLFGIEYLWKAGYDPDASIDLFESMESTERRQPGSVAKLFRSHPLTPDRIEKTQKNIDRLLPTRDQYIINTSEYEEMRARLAEIAHFPKTPNPDAGPTLRQKQQ
jgi:predicted Zn-dependent protease